MIELYSFKLSIAIVIFPSVSHIINVEVNNLTSETPTQRIKQPTKL